MSGNERATVGGKLKYSRLFFRRRKLAGETPETDKKWPKQETPGLLRPVLNGKCLYRRVLIKRKK